MKRRKRWRRIAMWAGLAACGGCLLVYFISYRLYLTLMLNENHPGKFIQRGAKVEIDRGQFCLRIAWNPGARFMGSFGLGLELAQSSRWIEVRAIDVTNEDRLFPREVCWIPHPGGFWGEMPLEIPIISFAIPTFFLWRSERRDRSRAAAGACSACGYNLTGNVTGRCPECGAAAAT